MKERTVLTCSNDGSQTRFSLTTVNLQTKKKKKKKEQEHLTKIRNWTDHCDRVHRWTV